MSIPKQCKVLVVGGGPGGSYTASVLGREGIDTVLLEADVFPRYHIGESMLPSLRHFLKFIDCDDKFLKHGFTKKPGAAFALNQANFEGFTDFMAEGGSDHFSWNVIRSEADEILFRHAGESGAKIFDGVKVDSIQFEPSATSDSSAGKPVSAKWTCKSDGTTGVVKFDYVVDASGRAGIINTKYLKNRTYNQGLKNVANWAYYKAAGVYGKGTRRENAPLFEALTDESGWAWYIPLHNGTTSVGVVMNQDQLVRKKKESGMDAQEFYLESLKLAPRVTGLLEGSERLTETKSASDYSYNSSSYAIPNARVVGDAGCFIDPFFSSGVHLAITSGLSAATTICAALKGDCSEADAVDWHSTKVKQGYQRFLMVVLSAYKQMGNQNEAILSDFGEDNFDEAFSQFKPIIQGTADVTTKITQAEFTNVLKFMLKAFDKSGAANTAQPSEQESKMLDDLKASAMKNMDTIQGFTMDFVNGRLPRLQRGVLGLVTVSDTIPVIEPDVKAPVATVTPVKAFVTSPWFLLKKVTG